MAFPKKKNTKLAKPKLALVSDTTDVAELVMAGVAEDFAAEDDSVFCCSDFLEQNPIAGCVSTGLFLVDAAIGYPNYLGIPIPSIIEILGEEATCKSSFLNKLLACMQQLGGWSKLVDVERHFTKDYGYLAGLDMSPSKFGYSQMSALESVVFGIVRAVERTFALAPNLPFAMGVDSLAACSTRAEQETKEGKDPARALHARLMSKAMRNGLTSLLYTKIKQTYGKDILVPRPLLLAFVNQLKSCMPKTMYEKQMDSFGGKALKYHARVRVQLNKGPAIKDGTLVIGNTVHAQIIKNKVGPSWRTVDLEFRHGTGLEDYIPTVEFMAQYGAIQKSGNRYVWKDKNYFTDAFRDFLRANPKEWSEVKVQCLKAFDKAWGKQCLTVFGNTRMATIEDEDDSSSELELLDD